MKKIFLIAGEASGDALGAGLMQGLKAQTGGQVEFSGVGGPKMQAEGLKSLMPMEELCVMGIWEVIWQLPRLLRLISGMVDEIEAFNPDALVTIDLPDFNFNVAKRLRKRGKTKAKLIHYVAPSVWAWRPGRAKKISVFLDGIMCLLPFEPQYFPKIKAAFVGHPLVEQEIRGDREGFRATRQIAPEQKTLGLFFGSRPSELKANGTLIKDIGILMGETMPDIQLIVPTLKSLEFDVLERMSDVSFPYFVVSDPDAKWDAMAACDAAVAVSGTVGLELALAGVPHVIVYRTSPFTWFMMKLLVKSKFAHLANILMGKQVVPEFLQGKAEPIRVSKAILRLYNVEADRVAQAALPGELRQLLGGNDSEAPSRKAAVFVLSMI